MLASFFKAFMNWIIPVYRLALFYRTITFFPNFLQHNIYDLKKEKSLEKKYFSEKYLILFATHPRSLNNATILIGDLRSDKINWQEDDTYPILI